MEDLITTYHYRDFSLPIYLDDYYYYTIIAGKQVNICKANQDYFEYIKNIIDNAFDNIWQKDKNTYLTFFNNAGNRDLKLIYKDRIIKVWVIAGKPDEKELDAIIAESEKIVNAFDMLEKREIKYERIYN